MILVRSEEPADAAAVRGVNRLAFGRDAEGALVDTLRGRCRPLVSLVAVVAGGVAGHILFSPVEIESYGASFPALGLGPMAVLPERQRRGVGSALVRRGLQACAALGEGVVVVLGHPEFFRRFGFATAAARGLLCEFEAPGEAFMVAELAPGALRGRSGLVRYRPEFAAVDAP